LYCSSWKTGNPLPPPFVLPFFLPVSQIIYETGRVVYEITVIIFNCPDSFTHRIAELVSMGDRCHDIGKKKST